MINENLKIDDVDTKRYWADFDKIPTQEERFNGCRVIRQDGINIWDSKVYQLAFPAMRGMIVYCLRAKKSYIYREGYWEENIEERKEVKERIKEIRTSLEANGNADLEDEYEALHEKWGISLPDDYKPEEIEE